METEETIWITCHLNDDVFRKQCYRACRLIVEHNSENSIPPDVDTLLKMYQFRFNETLSKTRVFAMKHVLSFKNVGHSTQLQLSKLVYFLLSIVKIIKNSPKQITEMKKIINVDNSAYFEFGKYILI